MKRLTPDHPKTLALMESLACSRIVAVGVLELLWHFTARYARQGNIGKWSDRAIADGIEWDGDPAALVAALVETGWLDTDPTHRLLVHDWKDHADEAVKKALARAGLPFFLPASCSCAPTAPSRSTETRPGPDPKTPSKAARGPGEAALPDYLEALRRLHPAFADELAVARALFECQKLLPPLAEFVAVLESWSRTEQWTKEGGSYAKRPAQWVRDGGYLNRPPAGLAAPRRRRGSAAIEAKTEGDLDAGTQVVEVTG